MLSIRETEVVRLTAKGMSSKHIVGRLNLSLYTVETHVRNIR
ncbi:MAG: LuxR C-terminal-related transcriptional regulator, partial [Francisellaceae bacterium]